MNTDIKRKWVEALRSGEYPQTTGRLQRTDKDTSGDPVGFCCLGVLCEIAVKEGVISPATTRDSGLTGYEMGRYIEGSTLPDSVREWAELFHSNPSVSVHGTESNLASINDEGATFNKIADLIEEQL